MVTAVTIASATITIDGTTVQITEGSVLLDAQQVPYATYEVTVPIDSAFVATAFDPRVKVPVEIFMTTGTTTYNFRGLLRSRVVSDDERSVRLTVTSDETFLQDYAPLVRDTTPLDVHSASLRAIVNYVLGVVLPGEVLAASPAPNKVMTPRWDAENLVSNPAARATTAHWALTGSGGTLSRITGTSVVGGVTTALRVTTGTATVGLARVTTERIPITSSRWYAGSVYVRCSVARTVRVYYSLRNSTSAGKYYTLTTSVAANTWTQVLIPGKVAGGTADTYDIRVEVSTTDGAITAGTTLDATCFILWEGDDILPVSFFDGATPDTATYQYDYDDPAAPDDSSSTRTTLVGVIEPSALVWEPGISAWDFLMPLVTGAGLRLFCNQFEQFFMVDPATYTKGSTVVADAANIVRVQDTTNRDDESQFATGVVLKYLWQDAIGAEKVAYDTAGTSDKVYYQEYPDTPYPGAGAAAAMLARRDGTGHLQMITIIRPVGLAALMEPYQTINSTPQFVVPTTGKIRSTRFDLTRALTDINTEPLTEV